MNKVYGVYKGEECEGTWLQEPVFRTFEKAEEFALELIKKENKIAKRMQDFCKESGDTESQYNLMRRHEFESNTWIGGYSDWITISIGEIEVV